MQSFVTSSYKNVACKSDLWTTTKIILTFHKETIFYKNSIERKGSFSVVLIILQNTETWFLTYTN